MGGGHELNLFSFKACAWSSALANMLSVLQGSLALLLPVATVRGRTGLGGPGVLAQTLESRLGHFLAM